MATSTLFACVIISVISVIVHTAYVSKDRCTFYQDGCAYHVVLAGSKCNDVEFVQSDDPKAGGMLVDEPAPYASVQDTKVSSTINSGNVCLKE